MDTLQKRIRNWYITRGMVDYRLHARTITAKWFAEQFDKRIMEVLTNVKEDSTKDN